MAELPGKGSDAKRPEDEERDRERSRIAYEGGDAGATAGRAEPDDPREEEGWTQPESSAQKGAPPDES